MRKMSIIECFLKGKMKDDCLCEDAIFLGRRFLAVIDGVTSKTKTTYKGKTTGRYASEIVKKELKRLESMDGQEVSNPEQILILLDKALKESIREIEYTPIQDYPRASVIFFDLDNCVVVSYGDCKCRIGDVLIENKKKIDADLSRKRSEVLINCLKNGESIETLRRDDPGRQAIQDDLIEQFFHENKSGDLYGYPVLNGCGINKSMIKIYEVGFGVPVILCSDGYPAVTATLKESERVLSKILTEDPLLIGNNKWDYKTTKGFYAGADSFDDRAWIRFQVFDK